MTTPRRFYLHRTTDITGVSGTGRVADGILWPDGTASVRWLGEHPSIVFWDRGQASVDHVHGHGGATQIVWTDLDLPTADYASAWTELTGYVQEAVDDGGTITPADLLAYMTELRGKALAEVREWTRRMAAGGEG
ncbi:hypothetical protein LG634_24775 [Streptomyces bambusae]|uniref:hypothetical protein n=1 Tax=Streptomyces bambusae TaxID=1550616 RepID=UPI001CFE3622|nr:hypothetical protein [Streptomyces bambusae]MCB5168028.1 hypothetical protein [Streptomyces bambusae]